MSLDRLADLARPPLKRVSTWDTTGGNNDRFVLEPGEGCDLAIDGAGCVRHIWFTISSEDPDYLRKARVRMFWDREDAASVDCPLGDFFCLGHGEVRDVVSSLVCVSIAPHIPSPPGQAAFNCYFPMPFSSGACIRVDNGCSERLIWYAHLDYESHDSAESVRGMGRFHAAYRSEHTQPPAVIEKNVTGAENYVILDTEGEGHYIGCNLSVVSRPGDPGKWWEGDEMIFVDGDVWPPLIHGTGTEDYFGLAWGVRREISTPYYGCSYLKKSDGERFYDGLYTVYRFHVADPIPFRKLIRVTLEHGHANDAGNLYSSVAYWYAKGIV